jgi:hypothetical protein
VDGVVGRVLQVGLDLDELAGHEVPGVGSDGDVVGPWGACAFGDGADCAEVSAGGEVDGHDEGLGDGVAFVGEGHDESGSGDAGCHGYSQARF